MSIVTVVGARPQFIKAGPVSRALASRGIIEHLVHTGQHYDLNMSDVFFDSLGLRAPDHYLGIGSGRHGAQTGSMLAAIENVLISESPDALLVYGDTNSTLAGALAASKLHVPVIHVEAGLRSFNRQMPEEVNRIVTDHLSRLLFCPTETAVKHLKNEGIVRGVHLVGDVMKDALDYWRRQPRSCTDVLNALSLLPGQYHLATVHRAENVDVPERLSAILSALGTLDIPVVLPLHPRTRKALDNPDLVVPPSIRLIDPVGYLEMLELQAGAKVVLTDSGGVQKEAYMLGVPCITLREETEWIETIDSGWNTLTGANRDAIVNAVLHERHLENRPELFGDGHASDAIVDIVQSALAGDTEHIVRV